MGYLLNISYSDACQNTQVSKFLFDRYEHATYQMLQAEHFAEASVEVLNGLDSPLINQ